MTDSGSDVRTLSKADLAKADELARSTAIAAMRERGLNNVERLLPYATVPAILAACRWFDDQHGLGSAALAKVIRDGGMEGYQSRALRHLDAQTLYANEIRDWLTAKLPDVCKPN